MNGQLLFHYAIQGIRRGGQRVVIAILSVAFGVMCLVAMSALADSITQVLLVDLRLTLGGDARVSRDGQLLPADAITQIEQMQADGAIEQVSLVANNDTPILKTPDSGRTTFLIQGIGVNPLTYPLLGEVVIGSPEGFTLAELLQEPGDVILTQDVASKRELAPGDLVLVADRVGGAPMEMRVAGIAVRTPSYQRARIYYDLETAGQLSGQSNPVTDAHILWGDDPAATQAELQASGWQVETPAGMSEQSSEISSTFSFMLKGAGILGLLVGGICIANTMQVLLAQRREEVAILKTLGYSRRDIIGLFLIETAVIGLVGSIIGVLLAGLLSLALVTVGGRVITLFLPWSFDPLLVLGGLLIGVLTTQLFALKAILEASDVRPAELFRYGLPMGKNRIRSLTIYGLLTLPFLVITSLILGSVVQGVGILLLALAGLIVLGLALGGALWLLLRLMPTFHFQLLRLARNNLRRRGAPLLFAMIALFIGIFTLGVAITVISVSMEEYAQRTFSQEGFNLVILADPPDEPAIRTVMANQSVQNIQTRYETPVQRITVGGQDVTETLQAPVLQGRGADLWDVAIDGATWRSRTDGAYVPNGAPVEIGEQLLISGQNGRQKKLTVVGTYSPLKGEEGLMFPATGILVSKQILDEIAQGSATMLVVGEARPEELASIGEKIGSSLPNTTVITSLDVDDIFSSTLNNLLIFALAMAGLALAAGVVLITNAVSLAMIERRFEIGVLKAVGYSHGQVLRTILLEYGLIALVASVAALFGVELFVLGVQYVQVSAGKLLHVDGSTAILILLTGIGITLLAALGAAWRPTGLRPLVVLNRE